MPSPSLVGAEAGGDGTPFLDGRVIVEMKFRVTLPGLFREMVAQFRPCPAGVSKYRLSLEACGAKPPGRADA